MKIEITSDGDDIFTNYNLSNPKDRGEVAHFVLELEKIKQELMEIWEEMN